MGQHLQQFARSHPQPMRRRRRRTKVVYYYYVIWSCESENSTNSLTPRPSAPCPRVRDKGRKHHTAAKPKNRLADIGLLLGWSTRGGNEKYTYIYIHTYIKNLKETEKHVPFLVSSALSRVSIRIFATPSTRGFFGGNCLPPRTSPLLDSTKFLYRIVRVKMFTRLIKFYILLFRLLEFRGCNR